MSFILEFILLCVGLIGVILVFVGYMLMQNEKYINEIMDDKRKDD